MAKLEVRRAALGDCLNKRRDAILQDWRARVRADPFLTIGHSLPVPQLNDQVRDLEAALESLRNLEAQRASFWMEAAHDLRGNLSVVAMASKGLSRSSGSEEARARFMMALDANVRSLAELLVDVTSLAKLQGGHETRVAAPMDASQLLRGFAKSTQELAIERGLSLLADGPDHFGVEGDAIKVRRIVQNLLLNALRYTKQGSVTISWGPDKASPQKRWFVQVEDTGPGLPPGVASPLASAIEAASAQFKKVGEVEATGEVHHGVVQDVSLRRAAAEERKVLLDSERAARQELQRLANVKDDFLATLSHELRTPLSSILGWVQILQRKIPENEPDLKKGVEVIERNARVQVQLINDLLDVSRITAGKLRLKIETIAPVSFIQAALETVSHSARDAGVVIDLALDTTVGNVQGDPVRLEQVIWNLLTNAIKFSAPGGRILVTLTARHDLVQIGIEDAGAGIDATALPLIFDRFNQADGSITRRHAGLGLGLSIVKHLVEAHGGSVQVSSAGLGRGATFNVLLPALRAQVDARRPSGAVTLSVEDVNLTGLKVMVVDDEADARDLVRRILEEYGAEVFVAPSAERALLQISFFRPDLLISDIGMPDMDGYEFLRQVRSLGADGGGAVPAMALTAFARSEDRVRAMRAGFAMHVCKPMEATELLAAIGVLTGRSQYHG